MVTLGEFLRFCLISVSQMYNRLANRLLRRDTLLASSEKKFEALINFAPDAMVLVDWHGHITLFNTQAERLFGYTAGEIIGQNLTDLIPERFRADHRGHFKSYHRSAKARPMGVGLDLFGLRKDGREFPAEISLGPLETSQGLLVSAAIRDISHRKQLENELHERAAALERSNRDLEQFAYVASHDLSAPLRGVSGFVELLRRRYEGRLDEDADRFIELTLVSVARMQAMIDDLLAYSRVGAETTPAEPVNLADAMESALGLMTQQIDGTGAQLTVGDLPTVLASETRLAQVFQNLLGNAVKFSRDAPVIEVSSTREDGLWRVAVRDHGIGVPAGAGERLFGMFERLHGSDEFEGTGIGLAICKRIIEQYGGEIGADPAPGGGTLVWFTLPAGEEPETAAD